MNSSMPRQIPPQIDMIADWIKQGKPLLRYEQDLDIGQYGQVYLMDEAIAEYQIDPHSGNTICKFSEKLPLNQITVKMINLNNFNYIEVKQALFLGVSNQKRYITDIQHSNIIRVVAVEWFNFNNADDKNSLNLACIQMENTLGSLRDFISMCYSISAKFMFQLLKQLLSALQCLHQNGISHRNIKPSNILIKDLSESGEIRAVVADVDFVSGPLMADLGDDQKFFKAPEADYENYDLRSDLYQVGRVADWVDSVQQGFFENCSAPQRQFFQELATKLTCDLELRAGYPQLAAMFAEVESIFK